MKCIRFIVLLLVIIGALNWGLVGFFQYDLVADIFGGMSSMASRVIYSLVGLAGLCSLKFLCKGSGCCCKGKCGSGCSANHDKCGSHDDHSCRKDG